MVILTGCIPEEYLHVAFVLNSRRHTKILKIILIVFVIDTKISVTATYHVFLRIYKYNMFTISLQQRVYKSPDIHGSLKYNVVFKFSGLWPVLLWIWHILPRLYFISMAPLWQKQMSKSYFVSPHYFVRFLGSFIPLYPSLIQVRLVHISVYAYR